MARKIYVCSLKGGTGATVFCTGLGLALAAAGERTLIVDGDRISGCGIIVCGLGNLQVYTLADYERGACRAKQTLLPHPENYCLSIMPTVGLIDEEIENCAVADVEGLFDYVICDKAAKKICDEAIIVTEPYLPSVKSADCLRAMLADGGFKKIGLAVNKINGGLVSNGEVLPAKQIAAALKLPLAAVIPEDLSLPTGKMRQRTENAFHFAAAVLRGKKEGVCSETRGYLGINGIIKRKLRERI